MNSPLRNNKGAILLAVLIIMALLISIIGAGLQFSGVNAKITGNYQSGTKAFYAADTGSAASLNQLGPDSTLATAAFSVTLGNGLSYRSGNRTDTSAQPLLYKGNVTQGGYAFSSGIAYNNSGYLFYKYQINVTGLYNPWGTEVAGREIEAHATYGPVSK
jgi:hypothetical protein